MTRIQKLLYLLDAEEGIRPGADGFKFEAYKAGPYSPRIYDDLELLENMSYIRRATSTALQASDTEKAKEAAFTFEQLMGPEESEASDPEKAEVDFTFEQLMGPEDVMAPEPDEVAPTADSYEETRYFLTDTGKKKVEELLKKEEYKPFVDGIRKVKSRFAKYSLNDLLYYVYTRHPGMTTESEIKEKVLRRRPT
jgi:uncharacterized protein YwgA